jgi:hypothetical protein
MGGVKMHTKLVLNLKKIKKIRNAWMGTRKTLKGEKGMKKWTGCNYATISF